MEHHDETTADTATVSISAASMTDDAAATTRIRAPPTAGTCATKKWDSFIRPRTHPPRPPPRTSCPRDTPTPTGTSDTAAPPRRPRPNRVRWHARRTRAVQPQQATTTSAHAQLAVLAIILSRGDPPTAPTYTPIAATHAPTPRPAGQPASTGAPLIPPITPTTEHPATLHAPELHTPVDATGPESPTDAPPRAPEPHRHVAAPAPSLRGAQSHPADAAAAPPPPSARVLAVAPTVPPTIPLAIQVQIRSTRPKAHSKRLDKSAVWDSGAGASFIDRKLAVALGARIKTTAVPMYFHGFSNNDHNHSRVDQTATVTVTAGTFSSDFTCWVCDSPPVPLLIGRDNQRTADGHGCTLRADDSNGYVQFDGHDPVPAVTSPHHPPPTATLAVAIDGDTRVRGDALDWVDVHVSGSHGHDVCVDQSTMAGIHVFAQTVCTDALGRASVLVHNTNNQHADVRHDSSLTSATRIADTPLHPSTVAALNQIKIRHNANDVDGDSNTNNANTDSTTSPPSVATMFTETKPRTSSEVRGSAWRGSAFATHEEAAAAFSENLPTEAELDDVLKQVVVDMEVGTPEQQQRTLNMLRKHRHQGLFSTVEHKHGKIKGHKVSVALSSNRPVFTPPYGSTPMQNEELCRQAEEMLAADLIKPTRSANNFPTLLVSKGEPVVQDDGSIKQTAPRLTLDLRKLNPLIITEFFELANVRHLCDSLAANSLHSSFDATAGYTQVELDNTDSPRSVDMMAFTLPRCKHRLSGQRFSHTRMVMGMKDAMARFSRIMHAVLQHHGYVHQYVDDIFVSNGSKGADPHAVCDEHIERLDAVFTTLADANVKLSPGKLDLFKTSIEALGHTIHNHTMTVSKKKTAAIMAIQPPTTNKELSAVMGILGLARRFMPMYAEAAAPLYQLLATDHRKFEWLPAHQQALDTIRARFTDADALQAPDFDLPFEVHCDASNHSAGAILTQRNPDTGISNIVEFSSTQFTAAERNYTVGERECLAIVVACKRWRPYLLASNRFTICLRTDHQGLTWIHRNSDCNSRVFRWCLQLSEFNYRIHWQPGSTMKVPDALSRVKVMLADTRDMMATSRLLPMPATTTTTTTATSVLATSTEPTWQIDRLVSEHKRPHHTGKFYRVRWVGFPDPDQDTIEPLAQLRKDLPRNHLKSLRDSFSDRTTVASDNALSPPPGFQEYFPSAASVTNSDDSTTPAATTRSPAQLDADNANELDTDAEADAPHQPPSSFTANTFPDQQLLPNITIKATIAAQRSDTTLAAIINDVDSHPLYHMHDSGLLMRSYKPRVGPRRDHDITTIALPESLVPAALAATHAACGHHGETSTTFAVQSRFHFHNVVKRTKEHVRGCTVCARAKRDLRPVPVGKIRTYNWLDVVSIDFAGPLRTSISGNNYLAIIVDNSTKWVHVHPCKSTSAADATAALLAFTQHCGLPGKVISDRGAAFTSKAWAGLMRTMGASGRQTAAYRPESNGMAEAQVGNIKSIIKCVCSRHPKHWDEAARWAAFSYNASYNSTIGCTPAFARTGREPRIVADIVFNNPNASDSLTLSKLIKRVNDTHRTTQERIEAMHDRFIKKNATLNKTRSFTDRQTVWLHRVYPGITKPAAGGLNRSFFWPFRPDLYEIIGKPSLQHAKIRNKRTGITQHVSTRRLKPYNSQADCFDFTDLMVQEETSA